jgi:hypothetical protein
LKSYKIPKEYLNVLSEDKHFNYYNTEQQQKDYINKWLEKSV